MGATRDIALNELPIRGISINPVAASGGAAAVTVVASDSGTIFINKYVTGAVTYTLPAVALGAGKMFWFFNGQTTVAIAVAAPTACIIGLDSLTGTTITTAAHVIGDACLVVGDGTNYYFFTWGVAAAAWGTA